MEIGTAIYYNILLDETYELSGESMDLEKAWRLFDFACSRNNWNGEIVSDFTVRIK